MLGMSATGVAFTLAGCSGGGGDDGGDGSDGTGGSDGDGGDGTDGSGGDGGDGTDGSGGDGGDGHVDSWLWRELNSQPTRAQFNPYNPNNQAAWALGQAYLPPIVYNPAEDDFWNLAAEDWEITQDEAYITFREQTWRWGDQSKDLTAEDYVTTLKMAKLIGGSVWNYIDDVEVEDERTVRFSPPDNPTGLIYQLPTVATPTPLYQDFVEQMEDATTDDELTAVKDELVQMSLSVLPSLGPFVLGDTMSNTMLLEVREDDGHPHASKLNFNGIGLSNGVEDQAELSLSDGRLDFYNGAVSPEYVDQQAPDFLEFRKFPNFAGQALYFNFEREPLGRRSVRRAITYATSRLDAASNAAELFYQPIEVPTGIPGTVNGQDENVMGDTWDALEKYNRGERDTETAAEILEADGFSKQNGTWVLPDGEEFPEVGIGGPSNWSWADSIRTLVQNLQEFGIPVVDATQDSGIAFGEQWPNGDFDMFINYWGAYIPYAPASFEVLFQMSGENPASIPREYELPPISEPSGAEQSYDINSIFEEIGTASQSELQGHTRELAWITNQMLPAVPFSERNSLASMNTRDWEFPLNDDALMSMNEWDTYAFDRGLVQAKQESPDP
jgi:peptide/nickel transport system substrate-binding protein